ncbi:MAG: nucleotidyltransferase family protein [Bacteroidetes bacterium]|nr:nucleotidyltransferase family protein [Bacteroidota bacterium]
MKTNIEIENKLKELLPVLTHSYNVRRIGYFGSFSMGTQTSHSDIDILVDFHTTPGWEFFDLLEFLEKELGRKIDMVTVNALKKQLRRKILRQVKYIA